MNRTLIPRTSLSFPYTNLIGCTWEPMGTRFRVTLRMFCEYFSLFLGRPKDFLEMTSEDLLKAYSGRLCVVWGIGNLNLGIAFSVIFALDPGKKCFFFHKESNNLKFHITAYASLVSKKNTSGLPLTRGEFYFFI